MKSLTVSIATILLTTATVSLSTAGTLGSPRALQAAPSVSSAVTADADYVHASPAIGSPKANALVAEFSRVPGSTMDCCQVVLAKSATVSPRAMTALPAPAVSPTGMKCTMGQHASVPAGCCAPVQTRKASCCG